MDKITSGDGEETILLPLEEDEEKRQKGELSLCERAS